MNNYFLSSLENKQLEYIRQCTVIRYITFSSGKSAAICKVDESVQWRDTEGFHGSDYIVVTARHEDCDIRNITCFPVFVYVAVLKNKDYDLIERITKEDLITLGIGELYESYDKARNHSFD